MERFRGRIPGGRNKYDRHTGMILECACDGLNSKIIFHCKVASVFPPLESGQTWKCFDQKSVRSEAVPALS